MTPAEIAKLLIGIGLLIIVFSFIFAVANMTGLIGRKKTARRSHIRLTGFGEEDGFDSSFRRHGLAMIGMVIGMVFIGAAMYIGGIDLVKEILRQFGVNT